VVLLAAGLVLAASARHGAVVSRTGQVLTAPVPAPHVG
jgi:hypothetical protein